MKSGIRISFIVGFAVSFFLIAAVVIFMPARYAINDDIWMINVLTGKGGFPPDTTMVFLSQTLCYILFFLYRQFPDIPWYGLTIYLAAYLGISLMISLLLRNTAKDRFSLLLSMPAFLICFVYNLSIITFTSVSLLLEFSVLLSLLEWMISDRPFLKHDRVYTGFLGICFILSFLLRWNLVLYALGLCIPILFFLRKEKVRVIFPVAVIIMLFIFADRTLFFFNTSTPQHREYVEYNKIRAEFNDTIKGEYHGETTINALNKAGWSPEDYEFFRNWIFYDERKFNVDTLKIFLKENNPAQKERFLQQIWSRWDKSFADNKHFVLIFFFTVLSILLYRSDNYKDISHKDKIRSFFSLISLMLIMLFLMYFRFVARVYVPLLVYFAGVFLILSIPNKKSLSVDKTTHFARIILVMLSFILFLFSATQSYAVGRIIMEALKTSEQEKNYIRNCLKSVEKQYQKPSILIPIDPSTGLLPENVHPLKEFSDYTTLRVFPHGTEINSPRYLSIIKQMGISSGHDFLRWTIDRNDVLFAVFVNDRIHHDMMKRLWELYYNRHIVSGKPVRLSPVYDFTQYGKGLIFYRMEEIPGQL